MTTKTLSTHTDTSTSQTSQDALKKEAVSLTKLSAELALKAPARDDTTPKTLTSVVAAARVAVKEATTNATKSKIKKQSTTSTSVCGGRCDGSGWLINNHGDAYRCPKCQQAKQLSNLEQDLLNSGLPDIYLSTGWDDLELVKPFGTIKTICETQIENLYSEGHNAVFWGEPEEGKTQGAMMVARAAILAGYSAQMVNLGAMSISIRAGYSNKGTADNMTEAEALAIMQKVDFLVIDDVGRGETAKQTVESQLMYQVLNFRYENKLPTILTTEKAPPAFAKHIGGASLSRLSPVEYIQFNHGTKFRTLKNKTQSNIWGMV